MMNMEILGIYNLLKISGKNRVFQGLTVGSVCLECTVGAEIDENGEVKRSAGFAY